MTTTSKVIQLLLVLSLAYPMTVHAVPTLSNNQPQKVSDQSQLIHEAEKKRFTIRRVGICCELRVRDEVLRQRIMLIEGEIFTKELLERSISELNTMKSIKPVRLKMLR